MDATRNVAVLVGSLRKDSLNRKMAHALIRARAGRARARRSSRSAACRSTTPTTRPIRRPPCASSRRPSRKSDAVLFVTPEFNRSVPGALKNALDVGSRPYGKSVWSGKPGAVVSVSPGAIGGFGANHHLRQSLVFLNVPAMPQPEAYIGDAAACSVPTARSSTIRPASS